MVGGVVRVSGLAALCALGAAPLFAAASQQQPEATVNARQSDERQAAQIEITPETPQVYAGTGLSAEQVAILLSREEGGTLPLEQAVSIYPSASGELRLGVWLEMDFDDLLPSVSSSTCLLDVVIYILRGENTIPASKARVVDVPCAEASQNSSGIRFFATFAATPESLSPGDYLVRSLITDRASRAFAVRHTGVRVPEDEQFAATALEVQGAASWLDISLDPGSDPPPIYPSTRIGVATTVPWSVRFFVRNVEQPGLLAEQADGESRMLGSEWHDSPLAGGWTQLRGEVEIDREATLSIRVVDSGNGAHSRTAAPPSTVIALAEAAGPVTWVAGSRGGREVSDDVTLVDSKRRRRSRLKRGEFDAALRAALDELAAGAPGALGSLAAVERRAIVGNGVPPDDVAAVELKLFAELTSDDPRAVLPILESYMLRYERHLKNQEYGLSTHCRRLATTLAQATAGDSGVESDLASGIADFHTAFGGSRVLNHDPSGRQSLRTALTLAEDPTPALAILVWHLEMHGQYRDVILLVDSHPNPPAEVRLRRALAALRLRRSRSALDELRKLAAGEGSTALLATQEIVRNQLREGEVESAQSILVEAMPRFRRSSRLPLLLALTHDLRGDRTGSAEAITRFEQADSANQRHDYSARPEAWVDVARQRFEQQASAGRSVLAAALEGRE